MRGAFNGPVAWDWMPYDADWAGCDAEAATAGMSAFVDPMCGLFNIGQDNRRVCEPTAWHHAFHNSEFRFPATCAVATVCEANRGNDVHGGPAIVSGEGAALVAASACVKLRRAGHEHTTVMLRNLPNNYTQAMIFDLLDAEGFAGSYDFLYLPIDFRTHSALGYAFVNLVSSEEAERLKQRFQGFTEWSLPSSKVCSAAWSQPHQGLDAHIERYRNSPLMHESVPDEYRPALFRDGVRCVFPPPTKRVKPPRQGTQRMLV
jgi:hypothetical protein